MSPSDDLLNDLAAPPQKAVNFREWLATQPEKRQAALNEAAADPRWSSHALANLLRKHGAPCSKESIAKWRAGLGFTG